MVGVEAGELTMDRNTKGRPAAVVIGATSKWQADGRYTKLVHGRALV
jgi:hypothetical protein